MILLQRLKAKTTVFIIVFGDILVVYTSIRKRHFKLVNQNQLVKYFSRVGSTRQLEHNHFLNTPEIWLLWTLDRVEVKNGQTFRVEHDGF